MHRNSSTCDESTLLFDVWLVSNLTRRLLDDALQHLGVSADEYGLYSLLHMHGPVTPTRICRLTGMAPTTVSGMVRRISARGHVETVTNPDDARSRPLRLTEAGRAATAAGAGVLSTLLTDLHDVLDHGGRDVHAGLDELDRGLRRLVGADPRPYDGTPADPESSGRRSVSYPGNPLTTAQADEVRMYIDWLRVRDARTG